MKSQRRGMAWVGIGPRDHSLPSACRGQRHLPLDQGASSPVQSGLRHFGNGATTASVGNLCQRLTASILKSFSQSCSSSPSRIGPRGHLASRAASALVLVKPQRFPWPHFPCPALFDNARQINPCMGIKRSTNIWVRVVLQHNHPAARPPIPVAGKGLVERGTADGIALFLQGSSSSGSSLHPLPKLPRPACVLQ